MRLFLIPLSGVFFLACQQQAEVEAPVPVYVPDYQQHLPFNSEPMDLLIDDSNLDGKPDIHAINHGGNAEQTFFQQDARKFITAAPYEDVGFHPGDLIHWSAEPPVYILGAEGANEIVSLRPKPEAALSMLTGPQGGFDKVSVTKESAPRHITMFEWPKWGKSLAVAPFVKDHIVLLRGYDPASGKVAQRVVVSLRKDPKVPSIKESGRITTADIDGDGVVELLFASTNSKEAFVVHAPKGSEAIVPTLIPGLPPLEAPAQVVPVDLNGDQAVDLVIADGVAPAHLNILLNDGHGQFRTGTPINFPLGRGVRQVAAARDQDGRMLLLAAGYGAMALFRLPVDPVDDPGAVAETLYLETRLNEASNKALLRDLDGDGWLDAVVGRPVIGKHIWVVYGPLWDHFDDMVKNRFLLD